MKKCLLVICVLALMLFCGCGKKQDEQGTSASSQPGAQPVESEMVTSTAPPPSSNETVVSDEEAPKVYWLMDTAYHLEGCSELSGKTAQEVPWSLVKEIGLRQCPVCNPPRYEGYVAAE